jgi:hypothetical protein
VVTSIMTATRILGKQQHADTLRAACHLASRQIEEEVRWQKAKSFIGPGQRDFVEVLPHLPCQRTQFFKLVGATQ